MNEHRAFGDRLIDRFQNGAEQSNRNRLRIPNRKLEVTDVGSALYDTLLAQGNHGSNLMKVVFGQPLRISETAQEESRGHRGYRRRQPIECHPLVYEVAS